MALATGPESYARAMHLLEHAPRQTTAGGLHVFVRLPLLQRHPAPGVGYGPGLERVQARRSGRVVIVAAVLLTALVVWLGCAAMAPGVGP